MPNSSPAYNLLIASYLEPEHIDRIRRVSPRLQVIYEPSLLAAPAYPADHYGIPNRTPGQEARWQELLARADILFDFDFSHKEDLPNLAPRVRWIQCSSAGVGQFVKRYGYDRRMPVTVITTASGIHVRPLAEFVLMTLLMHFKGALTMLEQQRQKKWQRYAGTDLEGRTLAVIGLGQIGTAVAEMACALGMNVIGANADPLPTCVARVYPLDQLEQMLSLADVLVLSVPHTPNTEKMIGRRQLAALKPGAYLINIARGAVIDEPALIEALQSGHLSGAALDVFADEPPPPTSPFWELPNVIVSPHSGSTSDRENERLTDLFCDNLRRFLSGQPLRNILQPDRYY